MGNDKNNMAVRRISSLYDNGKVERSHRNDNERFYKYLHYYSFDDLQAQMKVYLKRSNDIPTSVLRSKENKRRWLSPNEKEAELLTK